MIIADDIIRKKCILSTTYGKGQSLYNQKCVHDLCAEKISHNTVAFKAEVDGRVTASYETEIRLKVDTMQNTISIEEGQCSCPAFDLYGGFCKHLVAMAKKLNDAADFPMVLKIMSKSAIGDIYRYREERKLERKSEQTGIQSYMQESVFSQSSTDGNSSSVGRTSSGRTFFGTAEGPKFTSRELKEAMMSMRFQEKSRFCREVAEGDVELEVTLYLEANEEWINLKIGRERKYVLKSIPEFVNNIRDENYYSYGKKLSFVHSQSAFTKLSQDVIELLMDNFPENFYEGYGYRSRYEYRASDKGRLILDAYSLDRLMKIYGGKSLRVFNRKVRGDIESIPIKNENPKLPIQISGDNGLASITITFPIIMLLEGIENYYVWWENAIYICTSDYSQSMGELLKLMTLNIIREKRQESRYIYNNYYGYSENRIMKLCREDYAAFCAIVLPMLEKYADLEITGIDFSEYQAQEGKYEIYLDINKNRDVVCKAYAAYGGKKHNLAEQGSLEEAYRDLKHEYEITTLLQSYFPMIIEDGESRVLSSDDEDRLAALVEEGVNQLKNLSEVYVSDEFKKIRIANKINITAGLSIKGNLLNVSWNVDGMTTDELYNILGAYKRKKKYYRLKNGELLNIENSGLEAFEDIRESLNLTAGEIKSGAVKVPLYRALYLDKIMSDNADNIRGVRDVSFDKMMDTFDEKKKKKYELPVGINAELRPYQKEGYRWAKLLSEMGFGGILADDMGLGKTLQMITFMRSEIKGTHLVICPASLIYNWSAELQRFAPDMKVCMVAGAANERKALLEEYSKYNVVVTSYDLLKRDIEMYRNKRFECQIIDEAQYIKNPSTQVAKAVKSIDSKVRFALTGTPIENRLSELWSIFEYLMPGYLYSYKHFNERFEENIINENQSDGEKGNAVSRLHAMISPFLLRRLKKDVLKELPDKIEKVVYAGFGAEQDKLYHAIEKNMIMSLKKKTDSEFNESKLLILAELTKLRQICCDPALVYENYTHGSAKLDTCMELVESAVAGGHKILLFSQFASMLKILEEELGYRKIRTMTIMGSTSKVKRRQLVEDFQVGKADVFLISLKAGGTGLNLTAADMVIHYDPWWNVAAQNQATDRAHRIGQENNVTVVKLIAKNTIEERILKLQEMKKDLADKIISEEGVGIASMSKEELMELFESSSMN